MIKLQTSITITQLKRPTKAKFWEDVRVGDRLLLTYFIERFYGYVPKLTIENDRNFAKVSMGQNEFVGKLNKICEWVQNFPSSDN